MQRPPVMFMHVSAADVHHPAGLKRAFVATAEGKLPQSNGLRQPLIVPRQRRRERALAFNSALRHEVGDDGRMLPVLSRFLQFLSNKPASKPSDWEWKVEEAGKHQS